MLSVGPRTGMGKSPVVAPLLFPSSLVCFVSGGVGSITTVCSEGRVLRPFSLKPREMEPFRSWTSWSLDSACAGITGTCGEAPANS